MNVVIGDWHFNDKTMGKGNIPIVFLQKFLKEIWDVIKQVKPGKIKFIFNGDIFDPIHSAHWNYRLIDGSYQYDKEGVRPWDKDHQKVFEKAESILKNILVTPEVRVFLKGFSTLSAKSLIPIEIYYISRNHDRLIALFPQLRQIVSEAFGMTENKDFFFLDYFFDENLGLYVSHGNEYNGYNFESQKDKSPIGEAVSIELLNRLPIEILIKTGNSYLFHRLAEIEEIRPRKAASRFLRRLLKGSSHSPLKEKEIRKIFKAVSQEIYEDFFSCEFLREWLKVHPTGFRIVLHFLMAPILKFLHSIGRYLELDLSLSKIFNIFSLKLHEKGNLIQKQKLSSGLLPVDRKKISYAVLGHTHDYKISDLRNGKRGNLTYINLGTWCPQYYKTGKSGFRHQSNMAYAIFFEEGEEGAESKKVFEIRRILREEKE